MDPLGARPDTVDAYSLPRWGDSKTPQDLHLSFNSTETNSPRPRIECREDLNKKIAFWSGDLVVLSIEAIVNSTNESLTDTNPLTDRLYRRAGPDLKKECKSQLKGCKTGDAKVTKGYNLPARYVIHTVGPRYNKKYQTAAESALYSCYRRVFITAREKEVSSIAFCPINAARRGYPVGEGTHIALRTVRRFLEKHGDSVELIVFVTAPGTEDEEHYEKLLPLYFPRSAVEEQYSACHLPEDIGNEDGEPVIDERQIRIMDNPIKSMEVAVVSDSEEDVIHVEIPTSSVGRHDFAAMSADHDKDRQKKIHRYTDQSQLQEHQRRYKRLLKAARTEDLSEIASLRCLYQSGVDYLGRPVVVLVGQHFPANLLNLDKALLYLIHVLDTVVNRDYIVVYLHSQTSSQHHPPSAWLRRVYYLLDSRYKDHLRAFYIVHPTFWSKLMTWFFTMFTASGMKDKVHNIGGLRMLDRVIDPEQLEVPQFVTDHDLKVNGPDYYPQEDDKSVSQSGL